MKKEDKGFSKVGEVLDGWFKQNNMATKRTNYNAFHNWAAIVGSEIAKNTEPVKFYNDALVIKVSNSVWTQELQYLKPQLLKKIQESFPETKIRDLVFKVGVVGSPRSRG